MPRLRVRRGGARLALAVAAGRAAGALSRRLGRGSGQAIGGRVCLAVDPQALAALAVGRRIVLVSGTNGKSTTTRMTSAALGPAVCSNSTGANLPTGLVAALMSDSSPVAVLEVDELHLPAVIDATNPELVLLLNLTRDQLDRMHDVGRVAARWRDAIDRARPTVVAFADDPNVVAAARPARVTWVSAPSVYNGDVGACPDCGTPLATANGSWSCTCGMAPPDADVVVNGGVVTMGAETVILDLALPGRVNQTNAAFALQAARHFGVPTAEARERIALVADVRGRYASFRVGDRRARLLLAKNPASWAAALELVEPSSQLVVAINARTADGTDTSWLWDVAFEQLAGRRVGVLGDRAADIAVRLEYAGVRVVDLTDLASAPGNMPPGQLDVIGNYTAFDDLRRDHVRS